MTRQWEWNRAMLYKEDYEDKTTLTSQKFEDTSREIRRLSKSSCLLGWGVEGWEALAAYWCVCVRPCECDEHDGEKLRRRVFTSKDSKADT